MRKLLICGAAALALAAGLAIAQDRPERPRPEGRDGGEERPRMERRPDGLAAILDLDKDGALSAEEIAAAPESLGRLDRDHDGSITPEELRATQRRERRPGGEGGPEGREEGRGEGRERGRGGFLARYDANSDGVITREEYTTAVDEQFDRLDKNRDAKIDQEEAAAGGPGGRPGGQGRGRPEGGDREPR